MEKETITITKEKYEEMRKTIAWLMCLEAAGVDNWEGIGYAYELLEEGYPYDKDV